MESIKLIKERTDRECCIRTKCYANNWSYLTWPITAAKRDFPDLKDAEIKVVQYGGQRIKHQFGIEFPITDSKNLPKY